MSDECARYIIHSDQQVKLRDRQRCCEDPPLVWCHHTELLNHSHQVNSDITASVPVFNSLQLSSGECEEVFQREEGEI